MDGMTNLPMSPDNFFHIDFKERPLYICEFDEYQQLAMLTST